MPGIPGFDPRLVAAEDDDVSTVHAGMCCQSCKPVIDAVVNAIAAEIDEVRRNGSDQPLEVEAGPQNPRVGAKPQEQVTDIGHQRERGDVQKNAKEAGACDGAGMGFAVSGLQGPRAL